MTALKGQITTTLDGAVTSVLDNDTDPDGDNITAFNIQTEPDYGVITLNPDGTFSYVHDNSFNLSDRFIYRVCDDGDPVACADATVEILMDLGPGFECSTPDLAIPDDGGISSITDQIIVSGSGNISDMNVALLIDHNYVGDIVATLSHGIANVTLLDQPGLPALPPFGCDGVDIDAEFDDEATQVAEDMCTSSEPTIFGPVTPLPIGQLNDFDDQDFSGTWTLEVTDANATDTGTLRKWCLIPSIGDVVNTAPRATDDTMTAARGQMTSVLDGAVTSVLDNDSDDEDDNMTVLTSPVVAPRHGGLTLNSDGTFSYDHDGSFNPPCPTVLNTGCVMMPFPVYAPMPPSRSRLIRAVELIAAARSLRFQMGVPPSLTPSTL